MIIIGGATGAGKTSLSIEVAKKINGEVISLDSMQIYKYMDIGTAKIKQNEMNGIPHHMIDIIEPSKDFSVSTYKQMALNIADEVMSRGKVPLFVGGTGLYANAILYPYDFGKTAKNEKLRKELTTILEEKGKEYLYNMLKKNDLASAENIHPNNTRRVVRALEIVLAKEEASLSGSDKEKVIDDRISIYALIDNREKLYQRINQRVETMKKEGLEREVKDLLDMGVTFDAQSMQAIGYKEWNLGLSKDDVYEKIKQHTRNYAKRQITWFKQYDNCNWLNADMGISALSDIISINYLNNGAN